jgi:hypothetical protein
MKLSCFMTRGLIAAVLLTACGPAELPYNDNSQDATAYARDVKTMIATAARQAKGASEPLDYLTPVSHELARTDRPYGELRPVYEDLRKRLDELVLECQKAGGKAPNLSARLDELQKLAQTLPGETPARQKAD